MSEYKAGKKCGCLVWQDMKFPCKCAIAVAIASGASANMYVAGVADRCYRIKKAELVDITSDLTPVLAPTPAELSGRDDGTRDILNNLDEYDLDEVVIIKPPAMREKEAHGNRKRKRKERGTVVASTGRTRTASFAMAAAAAPGAAPANRTGACAVCTKAGRYDNEPHQASMCPYALPEVDDALIITISDDDANQAGPAGEA